MRSPDTVGLVRWLLDTNVVIDAFAGRPEAVKAIATARASDLEWIGYSAVTRLEVLGFPGLGATDASGLRQLLAQFSEAEISAAIIERAIEIRKSVRIRTPDAIIAATALFTERGSLAMLTISSVFPN